MVWSEKFLEFLQIYHRVRIEACRRFYILENAKKLNVLNVRRFCERLLIETNSIAQPYTFEKLWLASEFNYNRYLTLLLKHVESGKRLAAILKDLDVEAMSSEFMKQCTKYFFENSKNDIGE
ncbi:hypothetical protein GCK72_020822 [Caenorhabditis remanei]|uniref:Uncharacterized protein n=1 Tax=Caenorhabditis remanei TaxID=31234 RepID=A0A6A5GI98_CAERE|nr:hypothetical protein GCK72_020822 [Caenorhabditis remanei]KAF1754262.1 hypothetical protein GCK72_020822 [Caenorhabditis remanei]